MDTADADKAKEIQLIIDAMRDTSVYPGNGWYSLAARLVDAGYRKFEIVDGPELPYDGGAAFGELKKGGISVRDYFAAAAGKEEVDEARRRHYEAHYGSVGFKPLSLEQAKYAYADAMLEARKK